MSGILLDELERDCLINWNEMVIENEKELDFIQCNIKIGFQ